MAAALSIMKYACRLGRLISNDLLRLTIVCILALFSCNSFNTKAGSKSAGMQTVVRSLHLSSPQPGASHYRYVPFQVPPGTSQITVSYNYDHANGSNALDIGLFDSRSTELVGDVTGFRGWSGGRRSEFSISHEAATPGYIPGELPAGTWRIILGLYRVVPEGVDVTFKINLETNDRKRTNLTTETQPPQRFAATSLSPVVPGSERKTLVAKEMFPRWVSGDLHMHTVNSDGDWTIPQLIAAARSAGLDFISITDHNTYSHHAEIDRLSNSPTDLVVIRGEEITTYGGHANAWGLPPNALIDFRVSPGDQRAMSQVALETHRRGALICINHPFATCAGCNWSYDQDADGFDAVEVWNGSWDNSDEQALAWWDRLLRKGKRITAIGSSDSHRPANSLGQAASHVAIDGSLSVEAILKAVRTGRVYLTTTPNSPVITFEAQNVADRRTYLIGDVLRLDNSRRIRFKFAARELAQPATISLISQGQVIRTFPTNATDEPQYFEVKIGREMYFRMEVRDQEGKMLAMTNPIYVEPTR